MIISSTTLMWTFVWRRKGKPIGQPKRHDHERKETPSFLDCNKRICTMYLLFIEQRSSWQYSKSYLPTLLSHVCLQKGLQGHRSTKTKNRFLQKNKNKRNFVLLGDKL